MEGATLQQMTEDRIVSRALLVTDWFFPSVGGTEVLTESAAVALRGCGLEVAVATRPLEERAAPEQNGVAIHEFEADAVSRLGEICQQGRFDAMLVFSGPTGLSLETALNIGAPRPRTVVVPCINRQNYGSLTADAARLAEYRSLLAGADVVCVSSRGGFDRKLADELGLATTYVPNAVERLPPTAGFRDRWMLEPDVPVILCVANFWSEKNHIGLLSALRDEPGNWQLALVGGPSPHDPELATRILDLAQQDERVCWLGPLSRAEVASAMAESDVLVLPSLAEATPLVILEAMSHRLPWVATPQCGAATEHAGGVIAPVERFPSVLTALLADSRSREALGEAGHLHWRACYSWDVIGPRYKDLLVGLQVEELAVPTEAVDLTEAVRQNVFGASLGAAAATNSDQQSARAQRSGMRESAAHDGSVLPAVMPNSLLTSAHDKYWVQNVAVSRQFDGWAREDIFRQLVRGKRVLHVGYADWPITDASRNLHVVLDSECSQLDGFDVHDEADAVLAPLVGGRFLHDWEAIEDDYDMVLVPEVLEHVDNVQSFLAQLSQVRAREVVITVPDAVSCREAHFDVDVPAGAVVEVVHPDHNYWFSPYTLANVVTKYTDWRIRGLWAINRISVMLIAEM